MQTPISKLIFANKDKYIGDFSNDKRHGQGKYISHRGGYYEGNWVNDIKEGKGICKYRNGDKYEGDFKNDIKHGVGIYEWALGDRYEGNFTEGKIQGSGKYIWKERIKDNVGKEKIVEREMEGIFSNEKIQFIQKEMNEKNKK